MPLNIVFWRPQNWSRLNITKALLPPSREGCGCFRDLFGGSQEKSRENCWKIFPNREMQQILGFRAPGKANLPGTSGPRCQDLVPTFRTGCFLKSTVPAFSSSLSYGGGQSGAKFLAKFGVKFCRSFRAYFAGTLRAKKSSAKTSPPKFPWLCAAKLAKTLGKQKTS